MKLISVHNILLFMLFFYSCGIYTFSGSSISSEIKTVNIHYFENQASLAPANLSPIITETLKDKIITETNLSLTSNEGDLDFSGHISNYSIKPIAIQANETAAKNRLTISVKVTFVNTKQKEFDYSKTFSSYADYESNQEFSSLENELNQQIIDELVDNIFNEAVANW